MRPPRREPLAVGALAAGAALLILALIVDPRMAWRAPVLGVHLLAQPASALAGALVLLAFSANWIPWLPLTRRWHAAFLPVPWLPLVMARFLGHASLAAIAREAPSYLPWAAGITVLLAGRLLRADRLSGAPPP